MKMSKWQSRIDFGTFRLMENKLSLTEKKINSAVVDAAEDGIVSSLRITNIVFMKHGMQVYLFPKNGVVSYTI